MNLIHYEKSVIELCHLLGKILKVTRHSDPSAKVKKEQLLEKYQMNLKLLTHAAKESWPWFQVDAFLQKLPSHPDLMLEQQFKQLVLDKMRKDLSLELVPKVNLPEFAPPPTQNKPRPKVKPKPIQRQPTMPKIEDADTLMKLATLDPKQQQATGDLRRLIDVINKIGPEELEAHIKKQTIKTKK